MSVWAVCGIVCLVTNVAAAVFARRLPVGFARGWCKGTEIATGIGFLFFFGLASR